MIYTYPRWFRFVLGPLAIVEHRGFRIVLAAAWVLVCVGLLAS